jgi:hypothetical protein
MILRKRSFWPSGADRVRALRQLDSPPDLLLILRILFYAAAVPTLTLSRLTSWERFAGGGRLTRTEGAPEVVKKTVAYFDAVLIAFRPVVRGGCLVRGLTLYHFLRNEGVDVTLRFGFVQVDDSFTGHCWLVKDGRPYLEPNRPDIAYTETFQLPVLRAAAE